ncbi:serine kinase [Brevundimonas sp.]|jgi:serine kinase of HPr protein (carbohydrate metabolism regulator)|uniref:HPr kinase/phosphorylase n=1 Tax=Brevundimonas sp. TaxID=1871086 RepID=UPI002E0D6AAF|nr:serine kinase [Brevundimonas sp.]
MTLKQPVHGTGVALFGPSGWSGVLLLGSPGVGKSDLALRLLAEGARLVADDATLVWAKDGALRLACPETIAGRIEVRGLGIVGAPTRPIATLRLVVQCLDEAPERLPERETWRHAGLDVPQVRLNARAPSATAVVREALAWL